MTLAGNNYPNLPHSQEGMKFATQISPLLNFSYCLSFCQNMFKLIAKDLLSIFHQANTFIRCKARENEGGVKF